MMLARVFLCNYQHSKFEVPSFTNCKDVIGDKLKNGHVTLELGEFHCLDSYCSETLRLEL